MSMVTPWEGDPPSEDAIVSKFMAEGLTPSRWSNGPGDKYSTHSHDYRKVLYCVRGSIVFTVGEQKITLSAGDRLDLPPGTPHSATVGPDGVLCMEAASYA